MWPFLIAVAPWSAVCESPSKMTKAGAPIAGVTVLVHRPPFDDIAAYPPSASVSVWGAPATTDVTVGAESSVST